MIPLEEEASWVEVALGPLALCSVSGTEEGQGSTIFNIGIIAPRHPVPPQVERSGGPKLRLLKLRGLREEKLSPTQKGAFWRSQL